MASLEHGSISRFVGMHEVHYIDQDEKGETWFKSDNLCQLKGYKIVRIDRTSHAEGIAIFIKSDIQHNVVIKSAIDSNMEYLFIEISAAD